MAKRGAKVATPRLRFPEFRETGDWTTTSLGTITQLVTERVGSSDCVPYTITSGVGLVSQQEKLGRTIAGQSLKNYVVLQRDDFAYNKSATKAYPQGFIARYDGCERAAVPNSIFTCFRIKDERVHPAFLENLFLSNLHGSWLRGRIAVGARAHGSLNVSDDDLMALPVPLPPVARRREEQQRIAHCLTSLDEVIAAQGRKVEALKAHKRGLMQQIFPREGEARPSFRFPEFRSAPEWRETQLSSLGRLIPGLTYSPDDVREEGLLVLRSSNVQNAEIAVEDNVYVVPGIKGANLAEANDILICVRNGSKALIGKSALLPDNMPICTHGAFMTMLRAHVPKFAFQLLQSASFRKQVEADLGATINSINGAQLMRYRFLVPTKDEQLRIGDFLSSFDSQVAAETRQLGALKAHKQGLVQKLFPASEVSAA